MTYDYATCRAMMTKYLAWFYGSCAEDDSFAEWYLEEWEAWQLRSLDAKYPIRAGSRL